MNNSSVEFNFVDFELLPQGCYIVTMHCQNGNVVSNFAEAVHSRNKSHAKFKAFTVTWIL